jgi:transglutaminase-like putative cysteine protease
MDFSAWFEVFLEGRWWIFDARHNARRIGRVLMAVGRDAADVALTTIFGPHWVAKFTVKTDELTEAQLSAQRPSGSILSFAPRSGVTNP